MTTAQDITKALGGRWHGHYGMMPCLCHDDHTPSLQISDDPTKSDGVSVHCHAGCDWKEIKDALRSRGLLNGYAPPSPSNGNGAQQTRTLVATHNYIKNGELLYRKLRYEPKQPNGFALERPDGNGGWVRGLGGVQQELYNLDAVSEAIAEGRPFFCTEGEKGADALSKIGVIATSCGGTTNWKKRYAEDLRGGHVIILPDNDAPGERLEEQIARDCIGIAASIRTLRLPGLRDTEDPFDWVKRGGTATQLWELVQNQAREWRPEEANIKAQQKREAGGSVRAVNFDEFLKTDFPKRSTMLTPWFFERGLVLVHSFRGVGKTHFGIGVGWALAAGGGFLRWKCERAWRVLLIDGEMPACDLQYRLTQTKDRSQLKLAHPDYFKIAAADTKLDGLPDLSNPRNWQFYDDLIGDADAVLVDNISALCPSLKENESDSWAPMQSWMLRQRRAGRSAMLFHHDGKGGLQRGTSKKEDPLDAVISLRKPPDWSADQGCRFEVVFEKNRGFFGPDAAPFSAHLVENQWAISEIKAGDDLDTLRALRKQGLSIREISDRTGVSKTTVARRLGLSDEGSDDTTKS